MAEGETDRIDRIEFDVYQIEAISISEGALSFGTADFDCPKHQENKKRAAECLGYYNVNNKLPKPCSECYKSIIFWHDKESKVNYYTPENIKNLENLVNALKDEGGLFHGKISSDATIFYFNDQNNAQKFLLFLKQKMEEYNVRGILDWQKACGMYWRIKPKLWKGYKEFLGVE